MRQPDQPIYRLIVEIRGAFRELRALSDSMNDKIGVTAAMRAVMEHLRDHDAQTVPQIAQAKNVSRQNIQLLVDALVQHQFAEFAENPGHKRSKLVQLTEAGRTAVEDIRARETTELTRIAERFDPAEVETALSVLSNLRREVTRR